MLLASSSPRRRQLLEMLGLEVQVQAACLDEEALRLAWARVPAAEQAARLAAAKAEAVACVHPQELILAADTLLELEGEILGKAADAAQAECMLRRLAGRSHWVHTGVCVRRAEQIYLDTVSTRVFFRRLTVAEIAAYVATGEYLDKAGAYAIQGRGALLVERIEGDFYAVVGLPLTALLRGLRQFSVEILVK